MDGEFVHANDENDYGGSGATTSYAQETNQASSTGQDRSVANMDELDFLTIMVESRVFDISMIR